jgi:uracil phosphoribosyltransferase/phosphoserine phosphatase/gluconate kinase
LHLSLAKTTMLQSSVNVTSVLNETASHPSIDMASPPANSTMNVSEGTKTTAPKSSPMIIGVYGVSGCGKSTLLKRLEEELGTDHFVYKEGSRLLLDKTQDLPEPTSAQPSMVESRKLAIRMLRGYCMAINRSAIVAGHCMIWDDANEKNPTDVWTNADGEVYTHMIYLDVPATIIESQRKNDTTQRKIPRPDLSIHQLGIWKTQEKEMLREHCRKHHILFSVIYDNAPLEKAIKLVKNLQVCNEEQNLLLAQARLDNAVAHDVDRNIQTIIVLDADKTLAPHDTGEMFWKTLSEETAPNVRRETSGESVLRELFSSQWGYTYSAFLQAALLYEELNEKIFNLICEKVASKVVMYPEILSMLRKISNSEHVRAVVVSCGLRPVWQKVLEREGLDTKLTVIAGGRLSEEIVVTADVKAALVAHLQQKHGMCVWAFGDGPLDLEMLRIADQAIVIVGDKEGRSRSMDEALENYITTKNLKARQILLPPTAPARLSKRQLPAVNLTDEFIQSILGFRKHTSSTSRIFHATDQNAARLLMTPTRDADVHGHYLRASHNDVGFYLAIEFLSEVLGVEEFPILHVQGHHTEGYRIAQQDKRTLVVAVMRAGEPIAAGVGRALPMATFLHAKNPEDLKPEYLQGRRTIILADAVVNKGDTIADFVNFIRPKDASVCIIVMTAVAQKACVETGRFADLLAKDKKLNLIALRLSENSYKGTKGTDTGHRLFNTTFLA